MPAFTYTGDADRYYPRLGLTPVPGDTYDLDADPGDGRWTAAKSTSAKKAGASPEKDGE